ncbi:MAG: site-specific integrase [bacterium]
MRDIYHHKEQFEKWIKKVEKQKIKDLTKINSDLLISWIKDFRIGINISNQSKKGERSFTRLNHLRQKLIFILKKLEERKIKDVAKVTSNQLHELFSDMRSGKVSTKYGTPYKSTGDYVKTFKTFWHWHMKIMKKKGKIIRDITEDLDTRGEKAKFVYFTKEDFKKIIKLASYDLKPIIALAFDSGMRVNELINIKVSDFSNDYREMNIREETSKTFGRKIKLMLCSEQIREYINKIGLKQNDFLAQKSPAMINKELRKLGKEVLSASQIKFKNLTLYDFRHSSACFWLPKYKSESALKYRFGWKKSDMIHYYTEFLGMKDTITSDDLYDDITKADLEKEVQDLKKKYYKLFNVIKNIDRSLVKNISKA